MLEDLPEGADVIPKQTLIQHFLTSSLPLPLQIAALPNSLHGESSYDQVIRLGSELAVACRNAGLMFDQSILAANDTETHSPSQF